MLVLRPEECMSCLSFRPHCTSNCKVGAVQPTGISVGRIQSHFAEPTPCNHSLPNRVSNKSPSARTRVYRACRISRSCSCLHSHHVATAALYSKFAWREPLTVAAFQTFLPRRDLDCAQGRDYVHARILLRLAASSQDPRGLLPRERAQSCGPPESRPVKRTAASRTRSCCIVTGSEADRTGERLPCCGPIYCAVRMGSHRVIIARSRSLS
ncbi:hypothetical protein BD413DRAFT_164552 [Trametes elegans]|nr:hypothetical protein BD413DRAFT_164552 [Trametes elegans]